MSNYGIRHRYVVEMLRLDDDRISVAVLDIEGRVVAEFVDSELMCTILLGQEIMHDFESDTETQG